MPTPAPRVTPRPVSLITGAGSGIGRSIARALATAGHRLALVGRREDRLRETAALAGQPDALILPADLRDPEKAAWIVDRTVAQFDRLDHVINNAGYSLPATIPETTIPIAKDVFDLNALAPTVTISRAWPTLERLAALEGRGGTIVNISSYATLDPFPTLFAYAAAKASVNLLARSVANLGRPLGIRGFAVAPGAVETELLRVIVDKDSLPTDHTLSPDAVAAVVVACVQGKMDDRNGEVIYLASPAPGSPPPGSPPPASPPPASSGKGG